MAFRSSTHHTFTPPRAGESTDAGSDFLKMTCLGKAVAKTRRTARMKYYWI